MIKCKYKRVETIIDKYGNDWSNLILEDVDLRDKDLSKIKLPSDKDVFLKTRKKSIYGAWMPKGDYSDYCFDGVELEYSRFTKDSIFSKDKNVFQNIRNKSISGAYIPKGDYRMYDFKDVYIKCATFTRDSLLPENSDFFQQIYEAFDTFDFVSWPDNAIKNIHNYNLNELEINLNKKRHKELLTTEQINLIKAKYPEDIGKNIQLPNEVYGNNNSMTDVYEF